LFFFTSLGIKAQEDNMDAVKNSNSALSEIKSECQASHFIVVNRARQSAVMGTLWRDNPA